MAYLIKGFFIGIIFIIGLTLILAPMLRSLIEQSSGMKCNYNCCIKNVLNQYNSPSFIVLFGASWLLGSKISKLSYLIQKEKINSLAARKSQTNVRLPWEHRLSIVEDKE